MSNSRKSVLGKIFISEIVGMNYRFKSEKAHDDQFFKLLPGIELKVTHEPKNRFDKNACAVYLEGRKIGYLPSYVAALVVRRMKKKRTFRFFVFDPSHHYQDFKGLPTTSVLGIEQDFF